MGSTTVTERWATVVEWGAGHFDVICAAELAQLGVSSSQAKSWVRCGRLHRVHDRVWAVGRATPRPEGRWRAAVLSSPETVLSHHTAGLAHGLVVPAVSEVHVTTTTRARSGGGRIVHRASALDPRDLTTRYALPVTELERTIVDLADALEYDGLRRTFDHLRRLDPGRLSSARRRAGGRRGGPKLLHLLERDEPHTRSVFERRFLHFLAAQGLPRPDRLNVQVAGFEVDCVYDAPRLVVELDGRAFHTRGDRVRADHERNATLHLDGWFAHRLVWEQLNPYEAPTTVALLERLLARP